jgi:hypothetical protein
MTRMRWLNPKPIPATLLRPKLRLPRQLAWALGVMVLLVVLYLLSPYLTLWRLDHRVRQGPTSTLSTLVDIESVHDQILRRLNKDRDSCIGEVSEAFITWVQSTLRSRDRDALSKAITLSWVRQRLLTQTVDGQSFLPEIGYAFFDAPFSFRVRLGAPLTDPDSPPPVFLRLERRWLGWRVTALYY